MNALDLTLLQPLPDASKFHRLARWVISLVWLVNGLWCKVLGQVPRHEAIAARVLGLEDAGGLIKLIGLSEILMAAWVFSRIQPRLSAWVQIVIVAAMNVLEFVLTPDLLLFGRVNALLAAGFIGIVYWYGAAPAKRHAN